MFAMFGFGYLVSLFSTFKIWVATITALLIARSTTISALYVQCAKMYVKIYYTILKSYIHSLLYSCKLVIL